MRKQMESLIAEMLDGRNLLDEAMTEFEKIYIQTAQHFACLEAEHTLGSRIDGLDAAMAVDRQYRRDGGFQDCLQHRLTL